MLLYKTCQDPLEEQYTIYNKISILKLNFYKMVNIYLWVDLIPLDDEICMPNPESLLTLCLYLLQTVVAY